jgi:hypothetical protein
VCTRGSNRARLCGPSTSPLDGMAMRQQRAIRGWFTVALAALLVACSDIPGEYYEFKLREPPTRTTCIDLARLLAGELPLTLTGYDTKNACIAQLASEGLAPRITVNILSNPTYYTFTLGFRQSGKLDATAPTGTGRQLTSQIMAATQKQFPDAVVTQVHPQHGVFGP